MNKTRKITECALMIALGTVLAQIKLFRMPSGGSVTLFSMVPFILIAYRNGVKTGLLAGFANSLLQMALGGVYTPPAGTFAALAGSVMLDYVLAYLVLGLAPWFSRAAGKTLNAAGVACGCIAVCFLRFVCAFLSGFIIWGSLTEGVWAACVYSLGYNAGYLLPETVLTCLGMLFLFKDAPQLFRS